MFTQITLFDLVSGAVNSALDDLPEAEMVKAIESAIGISFKWNSHLEHYEAKIPGAKVNNARISVHYSNYKLPDNTRRHIGCQYDYNLGGSASPCDSLEEAITFFRRHIDEARKGVC